VIYVAARLFDESERKCQISGREASLSGRDPPEKREKDGRKKREPIDPAPHGDEKDGRAKDGSLHLQLGSIR
jgi:hypothetical protein